MMDKIEVSVVHRVTHTFPSAFWDRFGDLWELDPSGRNCRLVWTDGHKGPRTFSGGWVPMWYVHPMLAPLVGVA